MFQFGVKLSRFPIQKCILSYYCKTKNLSPKNTSNRYRGTQRFLLIFKATEITLFYNTQCQERFQAICYSFHFCVNSITVHNFWSANLSGTRAVCPKQYSDQKNPLTYWCKTWYDVTDCQPWQSWRISRCELTR